MNKHFWIPTEALGIIQLGVWIILGVFWWFSNPTLPKPPLDLPFKFPIYPIIPIPVLVGVAIVIISFIIMVLLDVLPQRTHKQHDDHPSEISKVLTTGFYSKIRHPIYLGSIQFNFGVMLAFRSLWMLLPAILLSLMYYFDAKQEERYLTDKFGDEYIQYKARTGMFLPKL
jgi:protein-S-isoprenylcysteine O-methyltransferase Ste14